MAAVYPNFMHKGSLPEGAGLPRDIHAAYLFRRDDSLVVRAICMSGFNMLIFRGRLGGACIIACSHPVSCLCAPGTKTVAPAADAAEAGTAHPTRPRWACAACASAVLVMKDFRCAPSFGVQGGVDNCDAVLLEIASPEVVPVKPLSNLTAKGAPWRPLGPPLVRADDPLLWANEGDACRVTPLALWLHSWCHDPSRSRGYLCYQSCTFESPPDGRCCGTPATGDSHGD